MPARSRQAIEKLAGLLEDRCKPQVELLLGRYATTLSERIRSEAVGERLTDLMSSRDALALHGKAFFPAFIGSLRQGCMDAFDHTPPPPPSGAFGERRQPLALLDTESVDEEGALAGIAARHGSRASHPLMLLGQRFAVLLERPPMSADALPVGPQAVGRALQHAARQAGLKPHARMGLYRMYDEDHAERYEATMEAADALLDSLGILPGLSFVPLRPIVVPEHPGRGRGHAPEAGLVAEIVAMRVVNDALDELVPQGMLPDKHHAERREAIAAMVRLVSRHGPDSTTWQQCRQVMADVADAARERRPTRPGTSEWMRDTLLDLGYSRAESWRLAEALGQLGQDIAEGSAPAPGFAGAHRYNHSASAGSR